MTGPWLDLGTALALGFVGACIGSFLNVVAYRMPRGMSVVWKPSHCPRCGHNIRPRDNVPVLGWLVLRGRCRDCGEPIAPRYALVEAAMGAAFAVVAYVELISGGANLPAALASHSGAWETVWIPHWPLIGLYLHHVILLSLLMAVALIDQDGQRVPWQLPLLGAFVAAASAIQWPFYYPERVRMVRLRALKAPLDAVLGATWAVSPYVLAAGAKFYRGQRDAFRTHANLMIGSALVGGFLGLQPAVRITLLCFAIYLVVRLLRRGRQPRLSPLWALWLASIMHITLWNDATRWLSW